MRWHTDMAVPEDLELETGPLLRGNWTAIFVICGTAIAAFLLAAVARDGTSSGDYGWTIGVVGGIVLVTVTIPVLVGLFYRFTTRRDIERFFAAEIWQQWQYPPAEWQEYVDRTWEGMLPEEGAVRRSAAASGITGLVLAVIVGGVGVLVLDAESRPILLICALGVFLLLLGIGVFQPTTERLAATRFRRQASSVASPRFWFGAEGAYDEAFGFTPLDQLVKVTDHTRSAGTITFRVRTSVRAGPDTTRGQTKYEVDVSFPVPSDEVTAARQLVRRYRKERIDG